MNKKKNHIRGGISFRMQNSKEDEKERKESMSVEFFTTFLEIDLLRSTSFYLVYSNTFCLKSEVYSFQPFWPQSFEILTTTNGCVVSPERSGFSKSPPTKKCLEITLLYAYIH